MCRLYSWETGKRDTLGAVLVEQTQLTFRSTPLHLCGRPTSPHMYLCAYILRFPSHHSMCCLRAVWGGSGVANDAGVGVGDRCTTEQHTSRFMKKKIGN